jgi:hypothetical protein
MAFAKKRMRNFRAFFATMSMAAPHPTPLFMAATQPTSVTNTHQIGQSILARTDINTQKG